METIMKDNMCKLIEFEGQNLTKSLEDKYKIKKGWDVYYN